MADEPSRSSFRGETARCYARYRREYPPDLIEYLGGLSQDTKRLLDLGCGTGQLLLQLAASFDNCVGIDPEPDMLREGRRLAAERDIGNVEWIEGSSAALPDVGAFDLITIGTAFHFMEPGKTLEKAAAVVRNGGAVAVIYNGSPMWLHPDPWAKELRNVLESWFGPLRDIDFTVEALDAAEGTMHELGYRDVKRWERVYQDTIDADFVVGHIFSALSADQVESSRRPDLARAIRTVLPEGPLVERVPVRAVTGRP